MKEELVNKILERVKIKKEILECLDEVVLKRLYLVDNNDDLEHIIKALFNTLSDVNVSIAYINFYESNLLDIGKNDYDIQKLLRSKIDSKLKEEALEKMAMAKRYYHLKYICYIYENKNIEYKDLITDIILKCSKDFQVVAIYNIFLNIEIENEKKYIAEYLELAKIIAKEKNEYKVNIYASLDYNLDILDLGLLLPVAKLIDKCKCEAQAKNMDVYLSNLNSENAPYVLKNARTADEDKLKSLYKYLTFCLNQSLLIDEEKINLIINARNKFNSEAIEDLLTYGKLIDTNLDGVAAEILNDSRKEYNANYASKIIYDASIDSLSGAMIVNESETRYKAQKVYNTITLYANTDEIDKSLEFASLINSVHTKLEIDLIYLLSYNVYLNKLGIALPIARIIANATESENDAIIIWECLKDEENKQNAINGFVTIMKNINPQKRQKAEDIINVVLLKAQNKPIHLNVVESVILANEKLTTKVKKLVNKKIKK